MASLVAVPIDLFFLPTDPLRGLRAFLRHLERLERLDPRVREAKEQAMERLASLPSDDGQYEMLGPLLWLQLRDRFRNHVDLSLICNWLGDGYATLRAVDEALATTLRQEVLREVALEAGRRAASDSVVGEQLERARSELREVASESSQDNPAALVAAAAVGFALGVAVGVAVEEVLHHHH